MVSCWLRRATSSPPIPCNEASLVPPRYREFSRLNNVRAAARTAASCKRYAMLGTIFFRLDWAALEQLAWLGAGGLLYTAGVPFYLWKTRPFAHAAWHVLVPAGVSCHAIAVASVMSAR